MLTRFIAQGGAARLLALLIGLALGATAQVSRAAAIVVPPPAPGPGTAVINFNGLASNGNNTAVGSYLNSQLSAAGYGGTVSVTGANGANGYDGEDFAVGPRGANGRITSLTLGNTDFGVQHFAGGDNFIVNIGSDRITMDFSLPIYSVSFDYEIFPNGSMPNGTGQPTSHPNYPDFSFNAFLDDVAIPGAYFRVFGAMPGTNGTFPNSPNHPNVGFPELAPQLLGHVDLFFPGGADRLMFIDWPVRIGVDNLTLGFAPQVGPAVPMPEPSAMLVWSLVAGAGTALGISRKRGRKLPQQRTI